MAPSTQPEPASRNSRQGDGDVSPDVEMSPEVRDVVAPQAKQNDRPEIFKSTVQEVLFIFVATMIVGLSSFIIGAVTVLSTFVGRSLHMSTIEITWITASTGLANGSFLLFFGRFADLFGRKSILVVSLAVFTVVCLGIGFAQNGVTVDILAALTGLTSASGVPAALGILGAAYKPSKRKNYAFACFGAGNPLGFVFGAIISGVATQLASWRATFWALAVIYFFVTAFAFFAVPPDTEEKRSFSWETLKEFDLIGALLTASGIVLFSTGLTEGSAAPQGWKTPYVIVLLILGVLLIAAFFFWENRFAFPLIPLHIFKDRNFSLLLLILALGFMAFPVSLFWASLYMQYVWELHPLSVAVHLLPAAIMGTIYNVIAGALLHRVSNKLLMGLGAVAYTISFLLMAIQRDGDSYFAFFFVALGLMVMGADFQFNVCNMYVMQSRPQSEQSVAGGILQTVTRLCVTVGFGIATAIYNSVRANPPSSGYYGGNAAAPYAAVFWFCTACAAISIALVPFLTIQTQGHEQSLPQEGTPDETDNDTGTSPTDEKSQIEHVLAQGKDNSQDTSEESVDEKSRGVDLKS